ncbi:malto-oligosyltrehalose trehalohydrolase [Pedobacter sp. BMA]|uniref:malto-oligosyltrehalose trehalohydrolase n=1 Tax=Pedobacter sp. BMA TaxID=1663685 RepID=UPI00064B4D65|nr:malto-oligosyltrehalose trehalohydrolase [Pedobacter sp. BMA]KLT64344.1 malto-oligosyltrehalose trehalohydrolase [Pedobacter sp. BMA]
MDINIQERQIGLVFKTGHAEIRVWAPYALQVSVILPDSEIAMRKEDMGYWFVRTTRISVGDDYRFRIEADPQQKDTALLERPDPASLFQPDGVSAASRAVDLQYPWSDHHWRCPALDHFIIYELHTGTFTNLGNFEGMADKLDHLISLGITAIELMPVGQFSGNRNWGYDGVHPFAVQHSYGGPKALQKLVDLCHSKGIAVILDVVYNHFGPEGNHFDDFGPYFTDKYQTPWGKAINFDDADSDAVRAFFIENCLMWFRDFHIDALRLDAVHAIKDFGAVHLLSELRHYTDQLSNSLNKPFFLIAELDLNDPRYISDAGSFGYGMHAQWIDEFHHALRVSAGGEKEGYYSDFNGVEHLAKSFRDAYVYDGQYSPHRQKTFGRPAYGHAGSQFTVFSQNHDQVGNRMLGERSSQLFSFEMIKLMAGAVFCSPFIPLIFMGEEWAESNPFQFFTSHSDPDLIEAVRKGRKAEFASFHAEGEAPDPQDLNTFNSSKPDWRKVGEGHHQIMLGFYKALISIRKNNAVLANLDRRHVSAEAFPEQNCVLLSRWNYAERVVCLLNFSNLTQELQVPDWAVNWYTLLDSAMDKWGGPNTAVRTISANHTIQISAESIIILTSSDV